MNDTRIWKEYVEPDETKIKMEKSTLSKQKRSEQYIIILKV